MDDIFIILGAWIVPGIIGSVMTEVVEVGYRVRYIDTSKEAIAGHAVIGAFCGLVAFGSMLWILCCDIFLRSFGR